MLFRSWVVEPSPEPFTEPDEWRNASDEDLNLTYLLTQRYNKSLESASTAPLGSADYVSSSRSLKFAADEATRLFDEIHHGRKESFSPYGGGYRSYPNYRWQAAKRSGIVTALKKIKSASDTARSVSQQGLYGVELPSTDTLIRRAQANRVN